MSSAIEPRPSLGIEQSRPCKHDRPLGPAMGNRAIEQKSAFAAIERSSKKVLSSDRAKSDRAKKCYRRSSKKTLLSYLSVSLMNKHNAKKKVKLKTSEQNEAHRLLKHILIILEIVDCAFF